MTRLLIADDEASLRKYLRRYLEGLGYEVRTAANGREAMSSVEELAPDVLITDLHMPDMDGYEILRALRSTGATFPIIAISGGGQFDKRLLLASAAALGAVLTLEKPFELEELHALVQKALAGPAHEVEENA